MMFIDQNAVYQPSHTPEGSSGSYSFCSSSSGNTAYTPPSTRRESFDLGNLDNAQFIDYESGSSFSMPSMSSDELSGMSNLAFAVDYKMSTDTEMFNMEPFLGAPFNHSNGLQLLPSSMPSLVSDLQSPLSDLGSRQNDFVDPTQTFINAYDNQPLACITKFESSPMSEYARSRYSPSDSMLRMPYSDGIKSSSTTPSRSSPLRQPIYEPLVTSVALQRAQAEIHGRRTQKKVKQEIDLLSNGIRYHGRARKECTWAGCNGKFRRQEHLKRHEKTHTNTESFPCPFCTRTFGRSDNLKSHIKLHTNPGKKSSRTTYFPDAVRVYAEMSRKPRKSSNLSSSPVKHERRSDASKLTGSRVARYR